MTAESRRLKYPKLVLIGHYLAAFVLILKAASSLEYGPALRPFVGLCVVSAAVIIILTLFHRTIEARFPRSQCLIHLLEGCVCIVVAYKTHMEGKTGLPYAWATASLILFARAAWEFHANKTASHRVA